MSAVLALALSGVLTACTSSSDPTDEADTKPGDPSATASTAPPGKHRTLPEACGTVSVGTLKDLLPGAAAEDEASDSDTDSADPTASPYEGEASVTYDTDRRVGCRWKSATTLGTRHLAIDFERVVSYDPAVSDDEQADLLYERKATKADIPLGGGASPEASGDTAGDPEGSGSPDAAESSESPGSSGGKGDGDKEKGSKKEPGKDSGKDGSEDDAQSEDTGADETDDASDGTEEQLSPRTLDGIGDTAYINDKLDTEDSGVHRDITLVFRTANVIATVEYEQWVTDKHRIPDSGELQDKAQELAEQLVGEFEED